jgi:tRNA(adenine34) deaminase
MTEHERFMSLALEEAKLAADEGEIPVGAVVVRGNAVLSRAHNRRERLSDPTAHAEILALREAAGVLGDRRLTDCALYVTLEPCPMCAGAMVMAKLGRCFFGASDEKQGCCESVYALTCEPSFDWRLRCAGGLLAEECQRMLNDFFATRRKPNADE